MALHRSTRFYIAGCCPLHGLLWEVKTWLRRDGRTVLLDRAGFAAGCDREDVNQRVRDHLDVARGWEREAARGV